MISTNFIKRLTHELCSCWPFSLVMVVVRTRVVLDFSKRVDLDEYAADHFCEDECDWVVPIASVVPSCFDVVDDRHDVSPCMY